MNKTSSLTAPNSVLDFVNSDETINTTDTNAASVTIATGPDTADVVLDIDGDEGVLLAVMTNLTLDVFGFVSLDGSLAFKKATGKLHRHRRIDAHLHRPDHTSATSKWAVM